MQYVADGINTDLLANLLVDDHVDEGTRDVNAPVARHELFERQRGDDLLHLGVRLGDELTNLVVVEK